jgi:hypothetical protein
MIEVRTGIRKTYRWRLGASRLSQASGRNPNRTDSETSPFCRSDLNLFVLSGSTADHGLRGVLGGRSPVGITSTGGSVQNEAQTRKTATPASADGTARPGIRGPGSATPHAQRIKSSHTRTFMVRLGRTTPAGAPRCPREARPPYRYPWCAGNTTTALKLWCPPGGNLPGAGSQGQRSRKTRRNGCFRAGPEGQAGFCLMRWRP